MSAAPCRALRGSPSPATAGRWRRAVPRDASAAGWMRPGPLQLVSAAPALVRQVQQRNRGRGRHALARGRAGGAVPAEPRARPRTPGSVVRACCVAAAAERWRTGRGQGGSPQQGCARAPTLRVVPRAPVLVRPHSGPAPRGRRGGGAGTGSSPDKHKQHVSAPRPALSRPGSSLAPSLRCPDAHLTVRGDRRSSASNSGSSNISGHETFSRPHAERDRAATGWTGQLQQGAGPDAQRAQSRDRGLINSRHDPVRSRSHGDYSRGPGAGAKDRHGELGELGVGAADWYQSDSFVDEGDFRGDDDGDSRKIDDVDLFLDSEWGCLAPSDIQVAPCWRSACGRRRHR